MRIFTQTALVKLIAFIGLTLGLHANSFAWTIDEFNMVAAIQTDGSVQIEETIVVDFTNETFKHGIIRDIPVKYKDEKDKTYKTPIENITVTDEKKQPRPFTKSTAGADLSLKIGEANKTVNASETYVIGYTVSGVINAFENHDEFFWNVTGNDWEAPINKSKVVVSLPTVFQSPQLKCFTGYDGSTAENCSHQPAESMDKAFFQTNKKLQTGEGFTLVFGWDKGLVTIPERVYVFDLEYWAKRLQYLILLLPLYKLYRRYQLNQERRELKTVVPLYHPPEPLQAGTIGSIERGNFNTRDLTAIITQLCVKGHLRIIEMPPSNSNKAIRYIFKKGVGEKSELKPEEEFVASHLMLNSKKPLNLDELSKLPNSIFSYKKYDKLRSLIQKSLKLYQRSTAQINVFKLLAGLVICFHLLFFFIIFSFLAYSPLPVLAFFSIFFIRANPPKLNKKGLILQNEVKGYRLFLETADKDRINWSEAQNIFETNLPYAIALDLTDKWASLFKDKVQFPNWYETPNRNMSFKDIEQNISRSAAKAITGSRPKRSSSYSSSASRGSSGFSSRGSSGGGRGGGGGRSW
jgi:uncharacterized membrane protein YgcG